MWHILLCLSDAHHILFFLIDFQFNADFPFPILRFVPQNHLAFLKDRLFKKTFLKRAKTRRLFSYTIIGSNSSFTLIENNFKSLSTLQPMGKIYPVLTP